MELELKQEQILSYQQLQGLHILQMSWYELYDYLDRLAEENPTVELELPPAEESLYAAGQAIVDRYKWLENMERHLSCSHAATDEGDSPIDRIGTDGGLWETLYIFLSRQIAALPLREEEKNILLYLSACLDDAGYLRLSVRDLADGYGASEKAILHYMKVLQSLDPAGVGAQTLSQCLLLQLERQHDESIAGRIIQDHMEDLAKCHFRVIAGSLGVSVEEVQAVLQRIRKLDPRPGSQFSRNERVPVIQPDIYVVKQNGIFMCDEERFRQPTFHISKYYRSLYQTTDDAHVKKYLSEKLQQADSVFFAVQQRKSTLLRCAEYIVSQQHAFFCQGAHALKPLRMADAADELDVHISTISRTVRDKYLQCTWGVFSLSYFFSCAAATTGSEVSGRAARTLMRDFINQEDKQHPLSDEKLCTLMKARGCAVSRRTITKYRGELNIPGAAGRKQRVQ